MAGNSNHIPGIGRYEEAHGRGRRPDNRQRGIFFQERQQGEQHFATLLRGTKLPLPDERIKLAAASSRFAAMSSGATPIVRPTICHVLKYPHLSAGSSRTPSILRPSRTR